MSFGSNKPRTSRKNHPRFRSMNEIPRLHFLFWDVAASRFATLWANLEFLLVAMNILNFLNQLVFTKNWWQWRASPLMCRVLVFFRLAIIHIISKESNSFRGGCRQFSWLPLIARTPVANKNGFNKQKSRLAMEEKKADSEHQSKLKEEVLAPNPLCNQIRHRSWLLDEKHRRRMTCYFFSLTCGTTFSVFAITQNQLKQVYWWRRVNLTKKNTRTRDWLYFVCIRINTTNKHTADSYLPLGVVWLLKLIHVDQTNSNSTLNPLSLAPLLLDLSTTQRARV